MGETESVRPPLFCRWLISIASWLVPHRARAQWRAKWDNNLWNWSVLYERGELASDGRTEIVRYSWTSFKDAFWLRTSHDQLRHTLRSPVLPLAAAATFLAAVALLTHGYQGTRALFQPLPLADTGSLVSIRYTGSFNQPYGVPPRLVPLWKAESRMLAGLAGFHHPVNDSRAWVTTNFFSMLGTRAAFGRVFRTGDTDVALLSGPTWRTVFASDPRIVGRTITLDGREFKVIGVLPDAFWAISRKIQVWTPLVLDPQPVPDVPFLVGAVGRLKPEATETKLRYELLNIARTAHRFLPRPPEVATFQGVPTRPLFIYLFVVGFALAIGIVMVATGRPLPVRQTWRYWSFLTTKTLLLVAVPSLVWVETLAFLRAALPETLFRAILTGPVLGLVFLVTCACALWWSFADQRKRCPVCLQRLAMPVTLGSWASVLDPVTTELLCDAGHGSLCLPETQSGESDRWTALDPSWRELFKSK